MSLMDCDFVYGDPGTVRCQRCGRITKSRFEPDRVHATCLAWPRCHEWGHWATLLIAVVGITPQGWAWLLWKLGFTAPCGCEERKKWLNTVGGRLATWLRKRSHVAPEPSPGPETGTDPHAYLRSKDVASVQAFGVGSYRAIASLEPEHLRVQLNRNHRPAPDWLGTATAASA